MYYDGQVFYESDIRVIRKQNSVKSKAWVMADHPDNNVNK